MSAKLTEETVRGWIEPWHDPHLDREYDLPSYDIAIRSLKSGFEANISVNDWRILIGFDPDYLSTACEKLAIPRTEGDHVGADTAALLYLHEVAHWRCCPFDADGHGRILQGLTEGLGSKTAENVAEDTIHQLSNIFADVIVNVFRAVQDPDSRNRTMYARAWMRICRFLYDGKLDTIPVLGKVFISLQYRLMDEQDANMESLVSEMEKDVKVQWALDQLIPVFRSDAKARKLLLTDRDQWQEQARKFAETIKHILPPPQPDEGGGKKSKEANRGSKRTGENDSSEIPSCTDNAFSRRFKEDAKYREEVIRSMLQRRANPGDILIAPRSVVLSSYYSERARQIVLKANDAGASPRLPVSHAGVRRIGDGEPISPASIRWSSTRLYPGADLQLFEKTHPLTIQRPAQEMPGRLPDLLFVLDSSLSMSWRFSPDPRSRRVSSDGTFDLALLAFFGIWHWLEASGCGPYLQYAAINFSQKTVATKGWHSHFDSKPVWDVLLSYEGAGTQLSTAALRHLREAHARSSAGAACGDSFWMILLTDGEIQNASEVMPVLQEFMSEGHAVTLVQLGGATRFSKTMRGKGADVITVSNPSDLVGLVLDRAKSVWQ